MSENIVATEDTLAEVLQSLLTQLQSALPEGSNKIGSVDVNDVTGDALTLLNSYFTTKLGSDTYNLADSIKAMVETIYNSIEGFKSNVYLYFDYRYSGNFKTYYNEITPTTTAEALDIAGDITKISVFNNTDKTIYVFWSGCMVGTGIALEAGAKLTDVEMFKEGGTVTLQAADTITKGTVGVLANWIA